jgi:uncharacterized membrane protein
MAETVERRTRPVAIAGHSIYSLLLPVPVVTFTGALLTDVIYTRSENLMWSNFSAWMILAGLVVGFVAGIFLLIDYGRNAIGRTVPGWISLFFFLAAWIIEIFNMLIHNQDGWTSERSSSASNPSRFVPVPRAVRESGSLRPAT